MKSQFLGLIAVGLLAVPVAATAQTLQYGADASIFVHDCSVAPGCNPSNEAFGPLPPLTEFVSNTAVNSLGTSANTSTFTDPALATGPSGQLSFLNASLTGTFGSPTINSAEYSGPARVSVAGWVLESYTWNGTGSTTRDINGLLTLSQTGGWPANGGSVTGAAITVFTTGGNTADVPAPCATSPLPGCPQSNATILASNVVTSVTPEKNGLINLNVPSFTLTTPGETIFVLMSDDFLTNQGGYVDASLVTTFSNETGLTPASSVTEPATISLFALGLAGLGFMRRRKAEY